MLKVTGSAMPAAGLSLLPFTVSAAVETEKEAAPAQLLRDDLSLYTAPPLQARRHAAEPGAGQLEERVAAVRRAAEPYTDRCRGAYDRIKPRVQSAVRLGSDAYTYLKNPPQEFLPRAGVIGFTGVLGLFLARGGSRIKKLVYPAALMTLSASLYYPEQAAGVAKSSGESVYERAVQSYAALERMVKPQSKAAKEPETKP